MGTHGESKRNKQAHQWVGEWNRKIYENNMFPKLTLTCWYGWPRARRSQLIHPCAALGLVQSSTRKILQSMFFKNSICLLACLFVCARLLACWQLLWIVCDLFAGHQFFEPSQVPNEDTFFIFHFLKIIIFKHFTRSFPFFPSLSFFLCVLCLAITYMKHFFEWVDSENSTVVIS